MSPDCPIPWLLYANEVNFRWKHSSLANYVKLRIFWLTRWTKRCWGSRCLQRPYRPDRNDPWRFPEKRRIPAGSNLSLTCICLFFLHSSNNVASWSESLAVSFQFNYSNELVKLSKTFIQLPPNLEIVRVECCHLDWVKCHLAASSSCVESSQADHPTKSPVPVRCSRLFVRTDESAESTTSEWSDLCQICII